MWFRQWNIAHFLAAPTTTIFEWKSYEHLCLCRFPCLAPAPVSRTQQTVIQKTWSDIFFPAPCAENMYNWNSSELFLFVNVDVMLSKMCNSHSRSEIKMNVNFLSWKWSKHMNLWRETTSRPVSLASSHCLSEHGNSCIYQYFRLVHFTVSTTKKNTRVVHFCEHRDVRWIVKLFQQL